MSHKILVLGESGFLGKAMIKALIGSNFYEVNCTDVISKRNGYHSSYQVDIMDREQLDSVIKNHDVVINCTGQITSPINKALRLNTEGMKNIAESVLKYDHRIIHISSVSVYGTTKYADESTLLNPETSYATLKTFTEFILKNILPQKKFMILRLSNLFGENQTKGIMAYLVNSLHGDRKLHFNNNGSLNRYYLHVDDCAKTIGRLICGNNISGTYNVIGRNSYTIKELVRLFEQSTDMKFNVRYDPLKPLENIKKISDEKLKMHFHPQYFHTVDKFFKKVSNA